MGNSCCNYSNGPGGKDPNALDDPALAGGKPIKMDPKVSEEMMQELRKQVSKIVKIQAVFRGFSTRKRLKNDDHIN